MISVNSQLSVIHALLKSARNPSALSKSLTIDGVRLIYTTNSIEAVHRQFRKLTQTKGGFPNENSLLKLLYLGIQNASKKWTMPIQNWNLALS